MTTHFLDVPPTPRSDRETHDRASTFQATEGGKEHYSGETLLIEAYTALWIILMAWLVMVWRTQRKLTARLDGLEQAIDRAAAKQSSTPSV